MSDSKKLRWLQFGIMGWKSTFFGYGLLMFALNGFTYHSMHINAPSIVGAQMKSMNLRTFNYANKIKQTNTCHIIPNLFGSSLVPYCTGAAKSWMPRGHRIHRAWKHTHEVMGWADLQSRVDKLLSGCFRTNQLFFELFFLDLKARFSSQLSMRR